MTDWNKAQLKVLESLKDDRNILVSAAAGSGKTAASLTLSAVLSSGLYDFSDTYIISVGCGGQLRHA